MAAPSSCASATARSSTRRIRRGDLVWRTNDPELEKRIRGLPVERLPVRVHVTAREGAPLAAVWEAAASG